MKFHYDPRPYLWSLTTVAGVALRRSVLHEQAPGDWELGNRLMRDLLAAQEREGSWEHDLAVTGRRLQDLLALDVVCNHPAVERAVAWLLDNLPPPGDAPFPIATRYRDALLSLIQVDRHLEPPVLKTVNLLAHEGERWLPGATPEQLAAGIRLLSADPVERNSPVVSEAFVALTEQSDGWSPDDERVFLVIDVCGINESPVAEEWLRTALPIVIERQEQEGGWGGWTPVVVRALRLHGVWDDLLPEPGCQDPTTGDGGTQTSRCSSGPSPSCSTSSG